MPLGGTEEAGGYKGYGLTLIVDVLTGVLGGSTPGPLIAPLFSPARGGSDIAQTFLVIDPDALGEPGAFAARLGRELDLLVASRVAPGAPGRVLIPGEPEAAAERRAAERGIVIDQAHHSKPAGPGRPVRRGAAGRHAARLARDGGPLTGTHDRDNRR